jgi:hypothetical protein
MEAHYSTWEDVFDNFIPAPESGIVVHRPVRAVEMQGGPAKAMAPPVRQDFLTIPELAARWRIARPTVYNRLADAGVRVLDFAEKGGRGRKIVPFGAVLEIERQQLRRL